MTSFNLFFKNKEIPLIGPDQNDISKMLSLLQEI